MDSQNPPPLTGADDAEAAARRSLVDDVRQLVAEGQAYAQAELAFQKSRAKVAGANAGGIAAMGALALAFAFLALVALVVGLLLALATVIGAWLAMVVVVAALLVGAGIAAAVAAGRARRLKALLAADGPAKDGAA